MLVFFRVSLSPVAASPVAAPFAQLLPGLHQFLHGAGWREGAFIDDAAIAVRSLIEIENRVQTQVGEIARKLIEVGAAQDFFAYLSIRANVRTARHWKSVSYFAFCSPVGFRADSAAVTPVNEIFLATEVL